MAAAMRNEARKHRRMPVQARSKATVEAILEASARILRRSGAKGLTTAAIADGAGVSVGSIYDYFPAKDAIFIALGRALLDSDARAVRAALAASPDEPIRAVIRTLIHLHRTDRSYRRQVMAAHIGAGYAMEHARTVESMMQLVEQRISFKAPPDPIAVFVAGRAVLGVCRALVDEPEDAGQDPAKLEDALAGLVRDVLGLSSDAQEACRE
jgi:AcrR family transcriptional regulator